MSPLGGPAPPGALGSGYVVPGPSMPPSSPVRPDAWPGGPGPAAPIGPLPRPAAPYVPSPLLPCETAQTVARVPNDVVLTGDLFATLDELMGQNKDKIPAADLAKQHADAVRELTAGVRQLLEHLGDADPISYVDPARRALIQQLLHRQVERKLIYQDYLRTVPKEALPNVEQMVTRQFEQTELPKLLEREGAQSRQDLEWKLRARAARWNMKNTCSWSKPLPMSGCTSRSRGTKTAMRK